MKTLNEFLSENEEHTGHLAAAKDHTMRATELRNTESHLKKAAGVVNSQRQREWLLRTAESHGAAANAHEDAARAHELAHYTHESSKLRKQEYKTGSLFGSGTRRRVWKQTEKEGNVNSANAISASARAHEVTQEHTRLNISKPDKEDLKKQTRSSGIRDVAGYHESMAEEHEKAANHLSAAANETPNEDTHHYLTHLSRSHASASQAHREAAEEFKKKPKKLPDAVAVGATDETRKL